MCSSPLCRVMFPILLALAVIGYLLRGDTSSLLAIIFFGFVVLLMVRQRSCSK
jgi:hypothetical protein